MTAKPRQRAASARKATGRAVSSRTGPHSASQPISEHASQVALFQWAGYVAVEYPQLRLMFAIPNGGQRHIAVAARMKAEGVKRGVPDIFMAVPNANFAGCWIELKTRSGRVSPEQWYWINSLTAAGYAVYVARSWEQAARHLLEYLGADAATIARLV
jgi:hypothetical protein